MGLKNRYEIPGNNLIGIHKVIVAIVFISLFLSAILMGFFVKQSQHESFKKFIELHKAGAYQGMTMSPLYICDRCHKPDKNHDYVEGWLISGAGDQHLQKGNNESH